MSEPQGDVPAEQNNLLTSATADRSVTLGKESNDKASLPPIASSTLTQPTSIAQRGFSKKLNDLVKLHREREVKAGQEKKSCREKFEVKNWKTLTPQQLGKMTSMARSRYLMYEAPPKEIIEKQMEALRRVRARKQQQRLSHTSLKDIIEAEENSELVGQLNAAQANWRILTTRKEYERNQYKELLHLVSSQPTAMEAIRLESFVPPAPTYFMVPDNLSKKERARCEVLLEDDLGLTTERRP